VSRVQQFMSAFATALDRRHLIDQLKDTNVRLIDADRHKSVFLASMATRRTPLNAILGFSELLIDAPDGEFPAATAAFPHADPCERKHLLG